MLKRPKQQRFADFQHAVIAMRLPRYIVLGGIIALCLIVYTGAIIIASFAGTILLSGSGKLICNNDFSLFFLPGAHYILAGHPFNLYSLRQGESQYPIANGPISEFAIAVVLAIGHLLRLEQVGRACLPSLQFPHAGDSVGLRIWFNAIFGLVTIGITNEILRLSDYFRRRPFSGWRRRQLWLLVFVTPPLWYGLIFYGHYELAIEILLSLLAVRAFAARKMACSGVLLGLALLDRTTALFVIIPLALLLVRDRRWRDAGIWGMALLGTTLLILAPFLLVNYNDTIYSLVTFRSTLPLGDGSFWSLFRFLPIEPYLRPLDSPLSLLLAGGISGILLWRTKIQPDEAPFYAIICLSTTCFALTIKSTWGYYFADPIIWGLVWVLGMRSFRLTTWDYLGIPTFFTMLMVLNESRIKYVVSRDQFKEIVIFLGSMTALALTMFIMVVAVMILNTPRPKVKIRRGSDVPKLTAV